MRCTHPVTAALSADGQTLIWSQKKFTKGCRKIQLPCRKCIECRLAYSREWGLRSIHEASMHQENSFITLTYDDESLKDPKLNYEDFQKFIRSLRDRIHQQSISYIVAGEYGSKTKRPHWHAVLFGYSPTDKVPLYLNHRGDQVSSSESLKEVWGNGIVDVGTVTLESASYCARYALKELEHGDQLEEYRPIFKASTRPAIGSNWLEKYAADVFNYGRLYLSDGTLQEIPRFYKRWCEKHRPDLWSHYVTHVQPLNVARALTRAEKEFWRYQNEIDENRKTNPNILKRPRTENDRRSELSKIRLKKLQTYGKF